MRNKTQQFFSTLVLSIVLVYSVVARAAITDPSPDFQDAKTQTGNPEKAPQTNSDDNLTTDQEKRSSISISTPRGSNRPIDLPDSGYFYPNRRALTVQYDGIYSTELSRNRSTRDGAELKYLFPTRQLLEWEAGFAFLSDGTGRVHGERRFIYSQERLRPYTTLGLGLQLITSDQLLTFIELRNYQIRAGAGLEYTLSTLKAVNLRLEATLAASGRSLEAGLSLGYVFPL